MPKNIAGAVTREVTSAGNLVVAGMEAKIKISATW